MSLPVVSGCVLLPAAAILGGGAAGAAGAGAVMSTRDNCIPPWEMHQWNAKMAMKLGTREPCPEGSTTPPPFLRDEPSEKPKKAAPGQ